MIPAGIASSYGYRDFIVFEAIVFNVMMFAIYAAITVVSIRKRIISWVSQVIMVALVVGQVAADVEITFRQSHTTSNIFLGLLLLPGIPLIASPLAVYYNRHR